MAEDPGYRKALVWLGISKCARYEIDFDLGDHREGMDLVEQVIKLDPTDSRLFVAYSIASGYVGRLDGLCCTNRVTGGFPLSLDRLIPRFP